MHLIKKHSAQGSVKKIVIIIKKCRLCIVKLATDFYNIKRPTGSPNITQKYLLNLRFKSVLFFRLMLKQTVVEK